MANRLGSIFVATNAPIDRAIIPGGGMAILSKFVVRWDIRISDFLVGQPADSSCSLKEVISIFFQKVIKDQI